MKPNNQMTTSSIKRISIWALLIYAVLLPLSLFTISAPEFSNFTAHSVPDGHEIAGEIIYNRGIEVSGFGYQQTILTGVANFETTTGRSWSSSEVLEGFVSGRIPHGKIEWRVNVVAVVCSLIPIWFAVAIGYWIVLSRRSRRMIVEKESD